MASSLSASNIIMEDAMMPSKNRHRSRFIAWTMLKILVPRPRMLWK